MPGFLLHDILLSKYSNNYILDIRDYTYEKYGFYLRIIHKLINNSSFTAISSRGFKKFLGESDKLVVNHNISNLEDACDKPTLYEHKSQLRLVLLVQFVISMKMLHLLKVCKIFETYVYPMSDVS